MEMELVFEEMMLPTGVTLSSCLKIAFLISSSSASQQAAYGERSLIQFHSMT
jgi:hypothetical protein